MPSQTFPSSAALQDYLLKEAGPGTLVLVPHHRLAHQVWHRQRLLMLGAGRAAWEPLPLVTLENWWAQLFHSLWPTVSLASPLKRLALWGEALQAAPPLPGAAPDQLAWAQALDEAHELLGRHSLTNLKPAGAEPPVVAWRRQVTAIFQELLHREHLLAEGELPAFLLGALERGHLALPGKVLVVGFPTPAPVEAAWLEAVARRTTVLHLRVQGDPQAVQEAVALPDRGQELEWVAAQLVECAAREGLPLRRLAVTAPDLDNYAPRFKRVLAELLGPPQTEDGWAYNFSKGPALVDTPLFQAALLPLRFSTAGERREDLVALLLSPYYGQLKRQQAQLARWDRLFREHRLEQGWKRFREVAAQNGEAAGGVKGIRARLHQAWETLRLPAASPRDWVGRLGAVWGELGFPGDLEEGEQQAWDRLTGLLGELAAALTSDSLTPGELLEWLSHGARGVLLPGPGLQEAGIQVLGLLEMRGLDFSRVWCLGMNAGSFPQPPRPLPLLSAAEKRRVLGGTYQSQHHFAREVFGAFLGAAPGLVLTRPRVVDQEERLPTPLYLGEWRQEEMVPLSQPHVAWLRAPAVKATFAVPQGAGPQAAAGPISLKLPAQVDLTQAQTALACPCRFLLEVLLKVAELPEIEAGLDPRERGQRLHQVLARFAADYQRVLEDQGAWDQPRARELLQAAARLLLQRDLPDLHWQAEWERWLGEGAAAPGLLWAWLQQEEERYGQGWRWQGLEVRFQDLMGEGWPFSLKGRIDRLDHHPEDGELVVWDYKSGETPSAKKVFEEMVEFQLPGYLLAVKQGRLTTPREVAALRAGFIGLKSPREKHLKYEDFKSRAAEWDRVLAAWEERLKVLGRRLAAGDFGPDPAPAPAGRDQGACRYCPYLLICGLRPELAPGAEGEEEW